MANYKKVVGTGKKLLSRVAGFSFMGVGVSWKAPEAERSIVRMVVTQLEDRRAPRFEDCKDERVLLVQCQRSRAPVYVKDGNMEHFFIRTGAATSELTGNRMQEFIKQRFR